MKHRNVITTIATAILLLMAGQVKAQPLVEWTKKIGGTAYNQSAAVDPVQDGQFFIVGDDWSTQTPNVMITKVESDGWTIWSNVYTTTAYDRASAGAVALDDGSLVIGGVYRASPTDDTDFLLEKFDSNGTKLWSKTYDIFGMDDTAYGLSKTNDGGFILSGFASDATEYHACVVRTDADGNSLWSNTYGGSQDEILDSVKQTKDGGFILVGVSNVDYSAYIYDTADMYLLKIDPTGSEEWSQQVGGSSDWDAGIDVIELPSGEFLATGTTCSYGNGGCDMYLVKTTASGSVLWENYYGSTEYDEGTALVRNPMGYIVVSGTTTDPITGDQDMSLWKISPAGSEVWNDTYNDSTYDYAQAMSLTHNAGYIIAGTTANNGYDLFVVKTESDSQDLIQLHSVYATDLDGHLQDTFNPGDQVVFHVSFTVAFSSGEEDVEIDWKANGPKSPSGHWIEQHNQVEPLISGDYHFTWQTTIPTDCQVGSEPDIRCKLKVQHMGLRDRGVMEFFVVAP